MSKSKEPKRQQSKRMRDRSPFEPKDGYASQGAEPLVPKMPPPRKPDPATPEQLAALESQFSKGDAPKRDS